MYLYALRLQTTLEEVVYFIQPMFSEVEVEALPVRQNRAYASFKISHKVITLRNPWISSFGQNVSAPGSFFASGQIKKIKVLKFSHPSKDPKFYELWYSFEEIILLDLLGDVLTFIPVILWEVEARLYFRSLL